VDTVFDITVASETVQLSTGGTGEASFTVSNKTAGSIRGRVVLAPASPEIAPWLKLQGDSERTFGPNKSEQFVVKVAVPSGTKAGKYNFRLDAVSVARTDNDVIEGPTVGIPVPLAAPNPPVRFHWWWVVAALVVIGALTLVFKLIPGNDVVVPNVVAKNEADADTALTTANLKLGTEQQVITKDLSQIDLIQSQQPAAASKVPAGTPVNVNVAVAIVTVPPLKNLTYDAAKQALAQVHLTINTVTNVNQPGVTVGGQVLDSNPEAGSQLQSDSSVNLTVQAAFVNVPNLSGLNSFAAMALVAANNLTFQLDGSPIASNGVPQIVSDWSPKGQVPIGTAITINLPGVKRAPPRNLTQILTLRAK